MAYIDHGNPGVVLAAMTVVAGVWHVIWTRYL